MSDKSTEKRGEKIYGTIYPVPLIKRKLRRNTRKAGIVYMTAVIEYIIAEVMEGATHVCISQKKRGLTRRHIKLSISGDAELNAFFSHCDFAASGVLPHVNRSLLPPAAEKRKEKDAHTPVVAAQ